MNVRPATEADNALVRLNPESYGYNVHPVWYPGVAGVQADFTMKNPTSEAVSMTVWFPLASALEKADWNFNPGEIVPTIQSFRVSVDGQPVEYTVSELLNPQGVDKPALPWASFPVTFPAGADTDIHVSYLLPLQAAPKGNLMKLYYIFQTGAGWDGPIGQAELIVNLPYPASLETMSAMGSLFQSPRATPATKVELPPGAILKGNQARWVWQDFEPGPGDDFAIWLMQPAKWQELEAARAAVQAYPQDGQAWLDLAAVYHSLSLTRTNVRMLFSPVYLQLCIEAYRKAAELLPEHPIPHAALGLFALEPYLAGRNAPSDVIEYVQSELQIARDLEAKDASLVEGALVTSWGLANALSDYYYNDTTATMDAATRSAETATAFATATRDYATFTAQVAARATFVAAKATNMACYATAGATCTPAPAVMLTPRPTLTPTPIPTATPQKGTSTTTPTAVPEQSPGQGQNLAMTVAGGVILLSVIGYLAWQRWRKSAPG